MSLPGFTMGLPGFTMGLLGFTMGLPGGSASANSSGMPPTPAARIGCPAANASSTWSGGGQEG
eukprot:6976503-Pyramimonas_sp.AAC.1